MPSLTSSISNFFQGLMGIVISLFNSVLAVFQSILALGQNILLSVWQIGQSLVKLVLDVFQGVLGFALANFFVILIVGGGYYIYNRRQQGQPIIGGKRSI